MLGEEGVPFAIIFTKADKSSASTVAQNVKTFCKKMLETWEEMPPYFVTSSENGRGREDVLGFIEKVIHQVGEE
jgi:GTP-binding protein